jgi:nucleoside-diphosphate-sugar epimerase
MRESVFITGATGFIGGALVRRLVASGRYDVTALVRQEPVQKSNKVNWTIGDLLDPEAYRSKLENTDTVIHLAAATGNASRYEHELTNVEGTRRLLETAKSAGVKALVHMSTMAVTYPDQRWYHYAQTKKRAESLVRESGIPSVILRPTMVLGAESPTWRSLRRCASLSIIPVPDGGRAIVQPIFIADLVNGIEQALAQRRFRGEALDLGGLFPLSFADLLRKIHQVLKGRKPWIVPVPLLPLRACLSLIEPAARNILPITAGQLAVFANDSAISPNWLHDLLKDRMQGLEDGLKSLVVAAPEELSANWAAAPLDSNSAGESELDRTEVVVFTRYLTRLAPSEYIARQYRNALHARGLAKDSDFSVFDRLTLRLARRGTLYTRIVDAYCAVFCRCGPLRRRLILLMAIVEHTAPYSDIFDRPAPNSPIVLGAVLLLRGLQFALYLLIGTALLSPAHLLSRYQTGRKAKGSIA